MTAEISDLQKKRAYNQIWNAAANYGFLPDFRFYTPEGCEIYPVQPIETVSTVGAGDNFNAGYIYAMLQGTDDQATRIQMAQRWSQDVCRQLGNNISDTLVATLIRP